jgi:polar amino acid transport system substrate-binding protein
MVNAGPPRRCRRFQAQIRSETLDSAYEQFVSGKLSALAGLKPRLLSDLEKLPGARILDGRFTSVQQAIGKNPAGAAFLRDFVEEAKASGLVARANLLRRPALLNPVYSALARCQ